MPPPPFQTWFLVVFTTFLLTLVLWLTAQYGHDSPRRFDFIFASLISTQITTNTNLEEHPYGTTGGLLMYFWFPFAMVIGGT